MKNKFDFDTIDINVKNPEDIEVPVYGIENKTVREIMFRINSKKAIKISKGDTAGFTLFLNKGSLLEPIPQTFIKESITVSTVTELEVTVDLAVWKQSGITETNLYSFTFYNENWYLTYKDHAAEVVSLSNYGITVNGTPINNDSFTVDYKVADNNYIQFYILPINYRKGKMFFLEKTIKSNGEIISKRNIRGEVITVSSINNDNVDNLGNMKIELEAEDTAFMPEGEFRYEIKAFLWDPEAEEYSVNTVTNRLPFYIVDDDYSANFINR